MTMKLRIKNCGLRMPSGPAAGRPEADSSFEIRRSKFASAFTLVEILVAVTLLSVIVIALMTVFNGTQTAFRAGVTQTDVLEGGRAAMDLITADLRAMTPSLGASNGAVNFYAQIPSGYVPLTQPLVASSNQQRTNVLENFFILSRENRTWTGVGYAVDTASANAINPLYRFSMSTNVMNGNPWLLFYAFTNAVAAGNFTGMSHLMDGVVGLTVRAFDTNGVWMNIGYTNAMNVRFVSSSLGEPGVYMFSNTVPAMAEVELAALEDRTLQRAESLPNNLPAAPPNDRRTIYLQGQAGTVHVFRQRVSIPNVDPSAYQ